MFTESSLRLIVVVSRHALGSSADRASRLGKLLLDDCLLRMHLVVQKLSRQFLAVVNLDLL